MKSKMERWPSLMARAQAGDQLAYRCLLRDLTPYLRQLVRRRAVHPGAIEDVVQEILISIHRARHTFNPDLPLEPWVQAIARRRCVDHLRGLQRQARLESELVNLRATSGLAAFADGPALLEVTALHRAVARLPEKQRLAVTRLKLEEQSLRQVAEQTGLSIGALKVSTHRGLAKLRKLLGSRDA